MTGFIGRWSTGGGDVVAARVAGPGAAALGRRIAACWARRREHGPAAAAEAANEKLHQGFASSKRRAKPQTHLSFADHKLGEKLVDFMFEEEALAAEHSTAEAA